MISNKLATAPIVIFIASVCEFHQSDDAKKFKETYLEDCQTSIKSLFAKIVKNLTVN